MAFLNLRGIIISYIIYIIFSSWSSVQKRQKISRAKTKCVIKERRIRGINLSAYNLPRHYAKIPLGSQLVCLPVCNVDLFYNLPRSFLLMIWGRNIATFDFSVTDKMLHVNSHAAKFIVWNGPSASHTNNDYVVGIVILGISVVEKWSANSCV